MGIDLNSAQLLMRARRAGVHFERMATLGRQRQLCNRQSLVSVLASNGFQLRSSEVSALLDPTQEYCEPLFHVLGARQVLAIDASGFEGAEIIHDLNFPIPDLLEASFDLVLDGGTLEHVFDIRMALLNSVRMARPEGRFISLTQANNFCGHGFYQFSPELYYRFLAAQNGYTLESCILWEDIPGSAFYCVPDPDSVRDRINITSEFGLYMFVQALRIGTVSSAFTPQQSDYARLWENTVLSKASNIGSKDRFSRIKDALKRISALRNVVQSRSAAAHYRAFNVRRNSKGYLTPLQEIKVIR